MPLSWFLVLLVIAGAWGFISHLFTDMDYALFSLTLSIASLIALVWMGNRKKKAEQEYAAKVRKQVEAELKQKA